MESFSVLSSRILERIQVLEKRKTDAEQRGHELDLLLSQFHQFSPVQFFPLSSKVDADFWKQFADRKLNEYKLSSAPISISGWYSFSNHVHSEQSWMALRADDALVFAHERRACGRLINCNTLEEFKSLDKQALIQSEMSVMLQALETQEFWVDPSVYLSRFIVLSFADLKRHVFVYWFAFPSLSNFEVRGRKVDLETAFPNWFATSLDPEVVKNPSYSFFFLNDALGIEPLKKWKGSKILGFFDPSPSSAVPGWFLRNLLLACAHPKGMNLGGCQVQIICLREAVLAVNSARSLESTVWKIEVPAYASLLPPMAMGWEPLSSGVMKPRVMNLSSLLDSSKVSDQAVNLNLKLMKWRAFPGLKEDALKSCKVLLLGCGTLGCSVARGLIGWGINSFTLVDSGLVSPSNPVRQSLFVASDVGKSKAERAHARLLAIHPGLSLQHWHGSIPMPGHVFKMEEVEKLIQLVSEHDVCCLLTDTRESRWLPTLLSAHFNKITLNAALDFDSYLVMRHGNENDKLGCYFCSDVMAPRNSVKNRTLDQQCTVTRPGLAPIAGALLVELLIAILHHEAGVHAEAQVQAVEKLGSSASSIPHVIRGYLGSFSTERSVAQSFPQCTACSPLVKTAFANGGAEFVSNVLENPDHLDVVTGLDLLKAQFDQTDFDFQEEDM